MRGSNSDISGDAVAFDGFEDFPVLLATVTISHSNYIDVSVLENSTFGMLYT